VYEVLVWLPCVLGVRWTHIGGSEG